MADEGSVGRDAAWAVHGRAGGATFRGIKRQDWRAGPDAARQLGRELAKRGEIGYWPEKDPPGGERTDKRGDAREPLRLRSAKLLDARYRFVCECRPNAIRAE
jgi:hypothetical protein